MRPNLVSNSEEGLGGHFRNDWALLFRPLVSVRQLLRLVERRLARGDAPGRTVDQPRRRKVELGPLLVSELQQLSRGGPNGRAIRLGWLRW